MSLANERITIIGYGSLVNKTDALRSCPNLEDFRKGTIVGFKRLFNKAFSRADKYQDPDLYPKSSVLTVLPDVQYEESLKVSLFSVDQKDYEELLFRERDYQPRLVPVMDSRELVSEAMIFLGYSSDEEFKSSGSQVALAEWEKVTGDSKIRLYRSDLLPHRYYLDLCLKGMREAGDDVYENFLDTTFLGDGITTIRQYLKENPEWTQS